MMMNGFILHMCVLVRIKILLYCAIIYIANYDDVGVGTSVLCGPRDLQSQTGKVLHKHGSKYQLVTYFSTFEDVF